MPGERRCDHEGQHDELVGIDAHQAGGLAVLRNRAQRLSEKREFHEGIEQGDGNGRDDDNQHALNREEHACDSDHLIAVGRVERKRDRPKPGQHRVLQHDGHADGRDQGEQLVAALAQGSEDDRVHQPTQRRADHQRDGDGGEIVAAERMREEIGGERAQRHDVGVRKVDLDQHAVNEGEPQRDKHVEAPHDDAVDPLLEDDGQHAGRISSRRGLSTTNPATSPCNGSCPSWCSGSSCRIRRFRSLPKSSWSQRGHREWTGRPWLRDAQHRR